MGAGSLGVGVDRGCVMSTDEDEGVKAGVDDIGRGGEVEVVDLEYGNGMSVKWILG